MFNAIEATKSIAVATDKIRMDILSLHRGVNTHTGFKIDLFVNELTLEPPGSNPTTNSTELNWNIEKYMFSDLLFNFLDKIIFEGFL